MRNIMIWLVVFILLVALFNAFQDTVGSSRSNSVAYTDLITQIKSDNVRDIELKGREATGHYNDGREFYTYIPDTHDLIQEAKNSNVLVNAVPPEDNALLSILISWFPMLLLIGVWIFFMRQMQSLSLIHI